MFSNCGTGEDSWESLGLQGDQTSQSILKEINPEYSLKGLMLKLKLQYFGHQMLRADSLEKTLMLVKIEERGSAENQMAGWHHWLNGHELEQTNTEGHTEGHTEGQGSLAFCSQRVRHDWATEQQRVNVY